MMSITITIRSNESADNKDNKGSQVISILLAGTHGLYDKK